MTVLVILEIERDDVAKELVGDYIYPGADGAKVIGAYKKPEDYCHCSEFGISNKNRGYTQGQVHGWWVCSSCKKMSYHAFHFFGSKGSINLIPQEIRAKQGEVFVNGVQTMRSKYEWSFLNGAT